MKTAFTTWQERIAPVFDVSRTILLVDPALDGSEREQQLNLPEGPAPMKIALLVQNGVRTLICGAISTSAKEQAEVAGIKVQSFIAGDLRLVIKAWENNTLDHADFSMPGCGRKRRSTCCGKDRRELKGEIKCHKEIRQDRRERDR